VAADPAASAPSEPAPGAGAPRARKDILAGLIFVAFGFGFAALATDYEVGTPVRMGPGYFPLVLGGILAVLGGSILVKGFLERDGEVIGAVPWRAIVLIIAAVLFFGFTVRGLGLVPATFVAALLSALASRRTSVLRVTLVSVGLTVVCVLVFVVALSLRLPLVGPWIGG